MNRRRQQTLRAAETDEQDVWPELLTMPSPVPSPPRDRRPPLRAPARSGRKPATAHARRGPISAQVAAMVGHELRTPLTTALMYISILEHQIGDSVVRPSVRSALDVTREEILRLERLVVRVTELQRIGHAVTRPRLIEVGRIVSETVRRALVGARSVPANVIVAAGEPLTGWWDDSAIEQIVLNLLSNALKFGAGRPIKIAVEPAPSGVRLTVADHGPGIEKAQQEKIFRPYVRSSTSRAGGLGLGLWLVRELAQAHGGRVTVRSRLGQGATFTVVLREQPPGQATDRLRTSASGSEVWLDGATAQARPARGVVPPLQPTLPPPSSGPLLTP